MMHFVYIDSNGVVTSSWTLRVNTFRWRRLQKMLLLRLQVDITLNTQTNNIINLQMKNIHAQVTLNCPTNWEPPWCGGGAYWLLESCWFHFLGIQRGGYYQEPLSLALRIWLMGVLKSLGTPSRVCVHGAFWKYHYLWAFSRADTGTPGIKGTGVFMAFLPYMAV